LSAPPGFVSLGDKRELGLTPLRARATELNLERDISDIIINRLEETLLIVSR
jgi:hypothetical protein